MVAPDRADLRHGEVYTRVSYGHSLGDWQRSRARSFRAGVRTAL